MGDNGIVKEMAYLNVDKKLFDEGYERIFNKPIESVVTSVLKKDGSISTCHTPDDTTLPKTVSEKEALGITITLFKQREKEHNEIVAQLNKKLSEQEFKANRYDELQPTITKVVGWANFLYQVKKVIK